MKVKKITRYSVEDFELSHEPEEGSIQIDKKDEKVYVHYLVRDENPFSPDESGDDGIFLVNYHRDFEVTHDIILTKEDVKDFYQQNPSDKVKELLRKYWIFKMNAYIHSGVVLGLAPTSFPDERWDVSHVGLVLVNKTYWKTNKKATQAAESLIQEWNGYLSGDVWGVIREVFDAPTKTRLDEDNESYWGVYDYKEALKELQNEREHYLKPKR